MVVTAVSLVPAVPVVSVVSVVARHLPVRTATVEAVATAETPVPVARAELDSPVPMA